MVLSIFRKKYSPGVKKLRQSFKTASKSATSTPFSFSPELEDVLREEMRSETISPRLLIFESIKLSRWLAKKIVLRLPTSDKSGGSDTVQTLSLYCRLAIPLRNSIASVIPASRHWRTLNNSLEPASRQTPAGFSWLPSRGTCNECSTDITSVPAWALWRCATCDGVNMCEECLSVHVSLAHDHHLFVPLRSHSEDSLAASPPWISSTFPFGKYLDEIIVSLPFSMCLSEEKKELMLIQLGAFIHGDAGGGREGEGKGKSDPFALDRISFIVGAHLADTAKIYYKDVAIQARRGGGGFDYVSQMQTFLNREREKWREQSTVFSAIKLSVAEASLENENLWTYIEEQIHLSFCAGVYPSELFSALSLFSNVQETETAAIKKFENIFISAAKLFLRHSIDLRDTSPMYARSSCISVSRLLNIADESLAIFSFNLSAAVSLKRISFQIINDENIFPRKIILAAVSSYLDICHMGEGEGDVSLVLPLISHVRDKQEILLSLSHHLASRLLRGRSLSLQGENEALRGICVSVGPSAVGFLSDPALLLQDFFSSNLICDDFLAEKEAHRDSPVSVVISSHTRVSHLLGPRFPLADALRFFPAEIRSYCRDFELFFLRAVGVGDIPKRHAAVKDLLVSANVGSAPTKISTKSIESDRDAFQLRREAEHATERARCEEISLAPYSAPAAREIDEITRCGICFEEFPNAAAFRVHRDARHAFTSVADLGRRAGAPTPPAPAPPVNSAALIQRQIADAHSRIKNTEKFSGATSSQLRQPTPKISWPLALGYVDILYHETQTMIRTSPLIAVVLVALSHLPLPVSPLSVHTTQETHLPIEEIIKVFYSLTSPEHPLLIPAQGTLGIISSDDTFTTNPNFKSDKFMFVRTSHLVRGTDRDGENLPVEKYIPSVASDSVISSGIYRTIRALRVVEVSDLKNILKKQYGGDHPNIESLISDLAHASFITVDGSTLRLLPTESAPQLDDALAVTTISRTLSGGPPPVESGSKIQRTLSSMNIHRAHSQVEYFNPVSTCGISAAGFEIVNEEGLVGLIQSEVSAIAALLHPRELDTIQLLSLLSSLDWDATKASCFSVENLVAAGVSGPISVGGTDETELEEEASFDCPVCLCEAVMSVRIALGCGHAICGDCWTQLVRAEISAGGNFNPLLVRCPGDGSRYCREVLPLALYESVLSKTEVGELIKGLWTNVSSAFLSACATALQCECGRILHSRDISLTVVCLCGSTFCLGCKKRGVANSTEPHLPASCRHYQQFINLHSASAEERFQLLRFKNCPNCGIVTTKCGCDGRECIGKDKCPKEACDHLSCIKCKHEWCWVCSGNWRGHNSSLHSTPKDAKEKFLAAEAEFNARESAATKWKSKIAEMAESAEISNGYAALVAGNRAIGNIVIARLYSDSNSTNLLLAEQRAKLDEIIYPLGSVLEAVGNNSTAEERTYIASLASALSHFAHNICSTLPSSLLLQLQRADDYAAEQLKIQQQIAEKWKLHESEMTKFQPTLETVVRAEIQALEIENKIHSDFRHDFAGFREIVGGETTVEENFIWHDAQVALIFSPIFNCSPPLIVEETSSGLSVVNIIQHGELPAAVLPNDIILSVNGTPTNLLEEFRRISTGTFGTLLRITLRRRNRFVQGATEEENLAGNFESQFSERTVVVTRSVPTHTLFPTGFCREVAKSGWVVRLRDDVYYLRCPANDSRSVFFRRGNSWRGFECHPERPLDSFPRIVDDENSMIFSAIISECAHNLDLAQNTRWIPRCIVAEDTKFVSFENQLFTFSGHSLVTRDFLQISREGALTFNFTSAVAVFDSTANLFTRIVTTPAKSMQETRIFEDEKK